MTRTLLGAARRFCVDRMMISLYYDMSKDDYYNYIMDSAPRRDRPHSARP